MSDQPVYPSVRSARPANQLAVGVVCVILAAAIAGGSVYAYERHQRSSSDSDLQAQINTLKSEVAALPTATPLPTPTATPAASYLIDATTAKAGDKVGAEFTVTSVQPQSAAQALSNANAKISFSGTLTTPITLQVNQMDAKKTYCTGTTGNDQLWAHLPQVKGGTRQANLAFCVTDNALSELSFGTTNSSSWTGTVTVQNVVAFGIGTQESYTADLVGAGK